MRKFIRHPTGVPIDIDIENNEVEVPAADMINVSAGGLAFRMAQPASVGSSITISIPDIQPEYRASGNVVWCREFKQVYEMGVQFRKSEEAFKARMVAQFCHIEDYRKAVKINEGRELSSDEAAQEWIGQYAEEFANLIGWQ